MVILCLGVELGPASLPQSNRAKYLGLVLQMTPKAASLTDMFELFDHPLRLVDCSKHLAETNGATITELVFATAQQELIRGVFCQPENRTKPLPAVLVIHAHGARFDIGADELMHGRPALHRPLGPDLASLGIVSLCLDMPCFGGRRDQTESAAAKARLWEGRSLAGQMMGECKSALDWLSQHPDVLPKQIGVFGISMGATLGYWLAAMDTRVSAVAHECCLSDFRALIETGAHDLHGIYLTIPGLLARISNGALAGMVAPRPQFIGLGDLDPLTPPYATDIALTQLRDAYDVAGGTLVVHRESGAGHQETAAMRNALLKFFADTLVGSGHD
jgi:hypothetical protein